MIPRIVVVDAVHDIARIVSGAMALLNRRHILVEVPDSESALEEIQRSSPDLLVTAYDIPGDMHGIELATQVGHETLSTPVIVLAEESAPRLEDKALEGAPFQYFVRPVGEPFLRGLRIGLDGDAAISEAAPAAPGSSDFGPVPEIEVDDFHSIIADLMRDVGAMGIILADRTGRVLIDEGATGYIDRETLAVILGPAFARSADVGPLVGGNSWALHYYSGDRLNVFGLSLGIHYLMCLIFESSNTRAMASVMLYGRRAAEQMIRSMGDVAFAVKEAQPLPPPKKESRPAPKSAPAPAAAQPEPTAAAGDMAADLDAMFDAQETEPLLEPLGEFDPDALFGQDVDELMADELFDPDDLSSLAAELASGEGDRVDYDAALGMGIIEEQ